MRQHGLRFRLSMTHSNATAVTDILAWKCCNQFVRTLPHFLVRREKAMQLHLETDELNLLANILLQRSSASPHGPYEDLLEMVLAHDLRFDSDELEQVADLLAAEKRNLKDEIAREADGVSKGKLQTTLALLERVQERVNEACVMI